MDERIKAICDKLGFDPRTYNPTVSGTEDDRRENPFSVLEDEELDYLLSSGYLKKNRD